MQLYESRIASLERFVAFCVMFHEMGRRVQCFWAKLSFGFLAYAMHRSQSMLRIATTASPVSGAHIREQMLERERERQQVQGIPWVLYRLRVSRGHAYDIERPSRALRTRL